MAKEPKSRGRPADVAKIGIYSRIDRGAVDALDAIAANMKPTPTRAQLINLAVQEFVERSKGKGRK